MMTKTNLKETKIGLIPENWQKKSLGELVTFKRGHDLPIKDRKDGEYPVIASNGNVGFHDEFKAKGPGVTIGRSGNLGRPFFIEGNYWPLNTTLYSIEFHESDPKFVYYFLKTLPLHEFNSGSAVPSLNRNLIHPIEIVAPNKPEQIKIAKILSSLDKKIELNQKMNQTLEEIGQAIFKHWFVHFEFPNEEGKPYKSSGGEMVDSELGEIPKWWEIGKISDFGKVICGKTPPKSKPDYFDGEFPFIKIPDMHGKTYVVTTEDSLSNDGMKFQKNKTIPKNSVCVSCIATVGLVCLTDRDSQTNQQINSILPQKKEFCYYLYFMLSSMEEYLKIMASGGSATLNLNTTNFSKLKILIPNNELLVKFEEFCEPLFNRIRSNYHQNENLSQIRDSILPKLMSGKIRVK